MAEPDRPLQYDTAQALYMCSN